MLEVRRERGYAEEGSQAGAFTGHAGIEICEVRGTDGRTVRVSATSGDYFAVEIRQPGGGSARYRVPFASFASEVVDRHDAERGAAGEGASAGERTDADGR